MRLRLYAIVARAISAFAPDNPRSRRRGCPNIRYLIVANGCSTVDLSVPEHPLHFGPGTSITSPLCSRGLGFGLSWSCILKYASSRGCGNVVIPQGFPKSVGSVESRFLGFPCFPHSVISIACF